MARPALALALAVSAAALSPAQEGRPIAPPGPAPGAKPAPALALSTNGAYLALTALSAGRLVILPLELELALGPRLSLAPGLAYLYYGTSALLFAECGVAWHPEGRGLLGWRVGASPGIAYAFDSRAIVVLSAEAGYQWALGGGLFLGAAAGGKAFLDPGDVLGSGGSMVIPDLRLRLGWAF